MSDIDSRVAALERAIFDPALDPRFKANLIAAIGVRFGTVAPTHTPDKETELWVIADGVDVRLWAYASGSWYHEILT